MPRQLRMVRPDLKDLPDIDLPKGYNLRSYCKGDALHWANIITDSFGGKARTAQDTRREIIDRDVFDPNGLFFVTYNDIPVGTACSWRQSVHETQVGYVHMVGVLGEHTGKKLGRWVSLAVLHFFQDNGFICAMLDTDDFRFPAIKTYLNLGFLPVYVDNTQSERWENICIKMNIPSMSKRIEHLKESFPPELWEKVSQ